MNLFGFDIVGLDVDAFAMAMRLAFVALTLACGFVSSKTTSARRIGQIILFVTIAGFAMAWLSTMYPLPNVYGTNGSRDRENHLGWTNVVALGFSPLRTFQVNHLHFEPVWPLLTAIASGFNVERVMLVFQWSPFVIALALALTIRFAWVRSGISADDRPIEAAFAALGALLLLAVPGDSTGIFRNPWALTFLLKPNHVLGLVIVPLAALALARARNWKTRLFAGFVLQLIGWAFILHMVLFVAGLFVFVALSWWRRNPDRKRDLIDVGTAIGANLLIVSPYVAMLVVGYPFLQGSDAYQLSFFSERPFEGPLRMGVLFLLSAFGAWRAHQSGGRLGRIFAAQWLTAQIIWQAFPLLGLIGQAREQDEAFYWCRFWTGLFAGVGGFQAIRHIAQHLGARGPEVPRSVAGPSAAMALLLLLPSLLPAWWDPQTMDQYFAPARRPLPPWVEEPNRFIRTQTPIDAVFTGDRSYARWIAAYGQRRVLFANSMNLPNDAPRRLDFEGALLKNEPADVIRDGVSRYNVQYLLVTSAPLDRDATVTVEQLRGYKTLEVVYDRKFDNTAVTIFKIHVGDRPE